MKNTSRLLACAILFGSAALSADGPAIMYLGGVNGPPDGAGLSPSFAEFRNNRGAQMLEQIQGMPYADKGTGYSLSLVGPMDYSKMVVTPSFESWNCYPEPGTGQHGNVRYDEGFYLYVNGGTFVPSQVSVRTESFIWNGSAWVKGGPIDITTNLGTVHSARIRMVPGNDGISGTADDLPATVQTGTLASTGFVFLSPAVGALPFGTGNENQRMKNALEWMTLNRLALKHTVSGTSTLGPFSFEKFNTSDQPLPPDFRIVNNGNGTGSVNWTFTGTSTVVLQESHGLQSWDDLQIIWKPQGTPVTIPIVFTGDSRHFWRVSTR